MENPIPLQDLEDDEGIKQLLLEQTKKNHSLDRIYRPLKVKHDTTYSIGKLGTFSGVYMVFFFYIADE